MERIQEITIVVTIETNKGTFEETFDDIETARTYVQEFIRTVENPKCVS